MVMLDEQRYADLLTAERNLGVFRAALEDCRSFFDIIDTLRGVECGDQRFIRKVKGHCWRSKWTVVSALTGKSLEDVIREHVQERIDDQPPDNPGGVTVNTTGGQDLGAVAETSAAGSGHTTNGDASPGVGGRAFNPAESSQ